VDWLIDPFRLEFMQRALVAGALVAVTTAVIGTWVVLRGLTFMGDAVAHGVLPGIAAAFLAGIDLTIGAVGGAVVMAGGINMITRRARLAPDTAIGLMFVGMLALGVVMISRAGAFTGELTAFLFGDVLGIRSGDLWLPGAAAVVALGATVVFYRPFLVLSFNEAKAQLLGLRPRLAHAVMLGLIAVAVVASFRVVGTLLVFGLLVGPPATASLLVRRLPSMMAVAVAVGVASVAVGLLASYHLDTAASATVATTAVAAFFVALLARELRELSFSTGGTAPRRR
jgi:ABC-type Mn2+/Zn2+ transport system permease subunit